MYSLITLVSSSLARNVDKHTREYEHGDIQITALYSAVFMLCVNAAVNTDNMKRNAEQLKSYVFSKKLDAIALD